MLLIKLEMDMFSQVVKPRKWLYPVLYIAFIIISMLPLYTEKQYAPQDTQDVIIKLLMVVTTPFKAYAQIFHVLTLDGSFNRLASGKDGAYFSWLHGG
jgi:hypothetical protein